MGNCTGKNVRRSDIDERVDYSGGNVCYITDQESWDEKISEASKDGKIVVVNFSAAWCAPCKVIAPTYSELSLKHPSVTFLTIDVDELPDFSTTLDIRATPAFFFFKGSQQLDKVIGANKPELEKKVAMFANYSAN